MHAISADELLARLDEPDDVFVLDVREPDEFAEWRIPGSVNIPLGSIRARLAEVPRDREVVAVCAVGSRASTAVSVLGGAGIGATVLDGGMASWAMAYDDAELDVAGATVLQVRRRGKGCLSYIVAADRAAAVIDPSADIDQYTARASARGWRITHVLDTHMHADHLSGARALATATGAQLHLNPADPFAFPFTPITDALRITIGERAEIGLSARLTPGHTMGSTTYVLGGSAVFTGDTLFLDSVGRPDLADRAEEFAHALYRSLHDDVLSLPDDAMVLPAHVGTSVEVHSGVVVGSTLGTLREALWQLDAGEDEFVGWAVGSVAERPPNYVAIVAANQGGTVIDDEHRRDLESGPNRCAVAG